MSTQQPSNRESQSFMDKFGPQSSGTTSGGQYYSQPSYQQPVYQQPVYQQPVYQVPGIPAAARTYRTASNMCFLFLFLLAGALFYVTKNPPPNVEKIVDILTGGIGLLWLAAWSFSIKSKGYSALLGLLVIFPLGAIILLILPNKHKRR